MDITDKNTLLELVKTAEQNLRKRDDRITRYRALYNMEHYSPGAIKGMPPEYERVLNKYSYQANDATNVVNLTVGILSHNALKVEAFTYRETKDANRRAGDIERLVSGLIRMNCVEQEVDLHNDMIHNMTIDGGVGIRTLWVDRFDTEQVESPEVDEMDAALGAQQKSTEVIVGVPTRIDVIPLSNLIYLPGGPKGRWFMVGMRDERTIDDVRSEFPEFRPDAIGASAMQQTCRFYDLWFWGANKEGKQAVFNAVVADNEVIRAPEEMVGYTDLPYTVGFFIPTQDKKAENWGLSQLFTIEEDIRMLENRINHQNRMLDIAANLPLIAKTRDGRPIDVDATYGTVVNMGTEESLDFVRPFTEPPDHSQIVAFAKDSISNGSYPPVTYGAGNGPSGYGLSQMAEGGRIRLEQPKRQIELMWEVAIRKMLGLYQKFAADKAIQVFGEYKGEPYVLRDLTGADTKGWFVQVKIDPRFPQDEARMVALGNQLLAIRGISKRTAQEKYFNIDDPDRESDRLLVEQYEASPQLMQALMMEAAKAYGIEIPEQAPSGGSPPRQPVSQPLMSNPEQGVLPPQAAGGMPAGQETPGDAQRVLSMLGGMSGG